MLTKTLNWSYRLLIAGGLMLAVSMLFHPDMSRPGFALQAAWVPVHVLLGISSLLILSGLVLLYMAVMPKISAFGHAAFWMSIIGTVLLAGLMFFVESTLVPVLAGNPAYSELVSSSGPLMASAFGNTVIASLIIAVIGFVMLGAYLMRSRLIANVNAVFLMIGPVLALFSPPLPVVAGIVGGVLFGIGVLWLGLSVRTGQAHETLEPILRFQDECVVHAGGHA